MIVKVNKEVVIGGSEEEAAIDIAIVILALAKRIGKEKTKGVLKVAEEIMEEEDEKSKRSGREADDRVTRDSERRCFNDVIRGHFFI